MTIDRIGSIEPIQPGKKPGRTGQVSEINNVDSINISSEAQEKAELYKAHKIAAETPDMRAERIAELKLKINDPAYIDNRILNATADRVIDALFG